MKSRNLFGTVVCAILVWAASSAAALGQNGPAAAACLQALGKIRRRRFPRRRPTSSPCAGCCDLGCCRRALSAMDGLGRFHHPGPDRRHKSNARCQSAGHRGCEDLPKPWSRGAQRQRFSPRLRRRTEARPDSPRRQRLRLRVVVLSDRRLEQRQNRRGPIRKTTTGCTMRAPGGFLQTNQKAGQGMAWDYATQLYNAEFNVRWNPSSRVTMLAGFRWVNLGENLVGALEPPTVRGNRLSGIQRRQQSLRSPDRRRLENVASAAAFRSTGW